MQLKVKCEQTPVTSPFTVAAEMTFSTAAMMVPYTGKPSMDLSIQKHNAIGPSVALCQQYIMYYNQYDLPARTVMETEYKCSGFVLAAIFFSSFRPRLRRLSEILDLRGVTAQEGISFPP